VAISLADIQRWDPEEINEVSRAAAGLPNGRTRTVLIDPAIAGNSVGPAMNLPLHHELGIGGRAFEPFDTGGWNAKYDVRVPLPPTEFGTVASPPSVPPSRVPTGTTQF
jgi:hypothetical protein